MPTLHTLCDAIHAAASDADRDAVSLAVTDLVEWLHIHPERAAHVDIDVLRAVRSCRDFDSLKKLADTLNGLGHPDPHVRVMLAQGLIDTGAASTAIDILGRIKAAEFGNEVEVETNGLTGRAFKDLYLRLRNKSDRRGSTLINLAIRNYGAAFDKSDETDIWSGENLLALLRRAQEDGVDVDDSSKIDIIAAKISAAIEQTPPQKRDYWQWATSAIVAVSMGNWDEARTALGHALNSKEGVDVFALGGTLRQLQEWWDIKGQRHEGADLIAALQARLLQMPGGDVRLTGTQMQAVREVPKDSFERIFGANGPATRAWMLQFLGAGASVGQITKKLGSGVGTCFVVDGGEFHDSLAGERLILTNDHVVSPNPERYTSNPPLRVNKAQAKFEVFSEENGPCEIAAKEIIWSSGPQDHDACLIRLAAPLPDALPALPIVRYVPVVDPVNNESIYIIGHPGGRSLSYSMQNNELLDHNCHLTSGDVMPCYIHYVTPTEPGSSGSPALNVDLDVIGLHHAGGKYMRKLDGSEDTYPANEAIWIESICRAARRDLEAGRNRYEG